MNKEVYGLTNDYRNSIFAISQTKGRQVISFEQWGAGEYKIQYPIGEVYGDNIVLYIPFLSFATLEKAMVFTKFCEKQGVNILQTLVGYLVYGRQERETYSEPKLINLVLRNTCSSLQKPSIIEPHNVQSIKDCFDKIYWSTPKLKQFNLEQYNIISPDKGASQRLQSLGMSTTIEIDKVRTQDGVVSTIKSDYLESFGDEAKVPNTFIIYDDMCDGGRTFANVAELVKEKYPNAKIELHIAHAILPFGVDSLRGKIDKIVALDTCFPQGTYFDGFLEVHSAIDMLF